MKKTALFFLLLALFSGGTARADESRLVPVQHAGRVKTFDAFARETMALIHGRGSWQKRTAVEWFYDAAARPAETASWKWVRIDYRPLAEALGLPDGRHDFSFEEVIPAVNKIEAFTQSARKKRDTDQTPALIERKAESLYQALVAVKALIDGHAYRVIPPAQGSADPSWLSLEDGPADSIRAFRELASAQGRDKTEFERLAGDWNREIDSRTGSMHRGTLRLESFYFDSRPFGFAALAYFLGFLLIRTKRLRTAGIWMAIVGFLLHTLGLTLRVLILSRPPVSNMYESMIWMNWVLMLSAIVLSAARRDWAAAGVGAIASAVVMIYGDLLPIDTGLDVLVPVLRSNYWLTIHVLTIVSSYGLFGLAMALGHRHLWLHMTTKFTRAEEDRSASLIYRTIQVGVLLLGIGTVLGGVWANESWGRFWGWDPKETWALITFLGYLVLIHLHFARIVKPFSLAVSAILGFLLVLFTWYGVNFVLGKGLHSYGQGSGGMNWILAYLGAEAVFLLWALLGRSKKSA